MIAPSSRRAVQQQSLQSAHVPAPIGGINTVDPAMAMPATDCIYAYNLIAADYGFRSRLGYQEWATELTGLDDNVVRTIVPFVTSAPNNARQYGATSTGLYDVTSTGAGPALALTFGVQAGDAGFGVSTVFSTIADRYCLYADEENGLHACPETTLTWAAIAAGTTALWEANTAVVSGVRVVNGARVYQCATAGTTAGSGGPTGTGSGIADGTATWNYVSASSTGKIGPSLADQNNGLTLDPADIAFVTAWKSRLWLVEKSTTRAWYLDVNSVFGTATSFDFGTKMRVGGQLVGLYNWTYDGGSGLDTRLVGLSAAGDVVIYAGTDPTSAETFGLVGCWSVGAVPAGRRIATEYGGDILILSSLGVLSLRTLVVGRAADDTTDNALYSTVKIANLFAQLVAQFGSNLGWALHIHPTDNALLVLVPQGGLGIATIQLANAFATKGWTQYRDVPMASCAVFGGQLYFGTPDGRVCLNTGYVDNVLLSAPDTWTPVDWSLLTAYTNLGNAQQKQVVMVRLNLLSDGPQPTAQPTMRYNLDISEPAPPTGEFGTIGGDAWDSGTWDTARFGGLYSPYGPIFGVTGMGREMAVAVRGSAISRTVLVGFDVFFKVGGLL